MGFDVNSALRMFYLFRVDSSMICLITLHIEDEYKLYDPKSNRMNEDNDK